jgi:hypothetical protein
MNTFRKNIGRFAMMLMLFATISSILSACNLKNPDKSPDAPKPQIRVETTSASGTSGKVVVFTAQDGKESIVRTFSCTFDTKGTPEISGEAVAFLLKNFEQSKPATNPVVNPTPVRCKTCKGIKENPNYPNRKEFVYEEGDIQIWNEACKCFQRFHYRDENREVCAYFNDKSPSKYSWMGFDNFQRDLPGNGPPTTAAPHCKR